MKSNQKSTTKLAIAGTLAACAMAATGIAKADPADNPSGFYVGAGWGQFRFDLDGFSEVGDTINDITESDDNAWKAFAGYRFNPYIAVEAAYLDFGRPGDRFDTSADDGDYRVEMSGFAPYLIGTLPLGPVELFAKVGYLYYDVETTLYFDSGPQTRSDHSESDFLYGGGVGITLFDHLHARAEYEFIDVDRSSHANAVWLSAAWRF